MTPDLSDASSNRALQEAASWFARHRLGPLSDEDAQAFQAWLKASPENARAWSGQERLWGRVGEVRHAPAILALREGARGEARRQRLRRMTRKGGLGLAAGIVLAAFTWHWQGAAPEVVRLQASDALFEPGAQQIRALPKTRNVSTAVGERALVRLDDGSTVTLNTDSAIRVNFKGRDRSITLLRGEAYFEVAKDKTRPFVVSAGLRQIIAVGTAFDVRLQPQQLRVHLVEGKVNVVNLTKRTTPAATAAASALDLLTMEAGTSLIAKADEQDRLEPLVAEHEISWRNGKLVFQGDRLIDVIAEMNRYSSQKIVIRDPAIEGRLLSGVFDPAGGAALARTLESYGMVRIVEQDSAVVILAAPQSSSTKNSGENNAL